MHIRFGTSRGRQGVPQEVFEVMEDMQTGGATSHMSVELICLALKGQDCGREGRGKCRKK